MQSKRKGLTAILASISIFLIIAVFVIAGIKSRYNLESSAADGDVLFTLEMKTNAENEDEEKEVKGGAIFDKTGSQVGPGTIDKYFEGGIIEVQFTTEAKYYELTGFKVTCNGDIYINNVPYSNLVDEDFSIEQFDMPNIKVAEDEQGKTAATQIWITFYYDAIEYKISSNALRLSAPFYFPDSSLVADGVINLEKVNGNGEGDNGEEIDFQIGDSFEVFPSYIGADLNFYGYALFNKLQSKYEYLEGKQDTASITIDKLFLDKYLYNDKIIITGVLLKAYSITVELDENCTIVSIFNLLTQEKKDLENKEDIEEFFSKKIDEFTRISIKAKNSTYFTNYKISLIKQGSVINSSENSAYNISSLSEEHDGCVIKTEFTKAEYDLIVDGVDSLNRPIAGFGGYLEVSKTKVSLGDTVSISLINLDDLEKSGYYDYSFWVKNATANSYIKLENAPEGCLLEIESDFLQEYLNLNTKSITIRIVFIIKYAFSIDYSISGAIADLCSYKVLINGIDTKLDTNGNFSEKIYNHGTKITISFTKSKYAVLSLNGVYDNEKKGDVIEIILNNKDRNNISISYLPLKFNLTDNTKKTEGYSVFNLEGLTLGSFIEIYLGIKENNKYEIKSWYINNVDVLNNLPKGAVYSDGVLRIELTEEWLNIFENFGFTNTITTGFKASYLLMVAGIPSVVAALIILFIIIFVTNSKRKRFIKAELLDEKMKGYTYNSGNMISDLRDDKFMKVSKAEIKARKKQQNEEARILKERWRNFSEDLKDDKLSDNEITERLEGASLVKKDYSKPEDFDGENFKEGIVITQEDMKMWRENQKEDLLTYKERQRQFEEDLKRAKKEIKEENNMETDD